MWVRRFALEIRQKTGGSTEIQKKTKVSYGVGAGKHCVALSRANLGLQLLFYWLLCGKQCQGHERRTKYYTAIKRPFYFLDQGKFFQSFASTNHSGCAEWERRLCPTTTITIITDKLIVSVSTRHGLTNETHVKPYKLSDI